MKKLGIINPANLEDCHILFIIGNGFDLGLGMKTRYEDIYKGYINTTPKSQVIENFIKELSSRKPYDKWSDFEMGMAEYASSLSSEHELIECIRDFKHHLSKHIEAENDKMLSLIMDNTYRKDLVDELSRSLNGFYDGLIPNDVNTIKNIIGDAYPVYNYITFNYTTVLEALFAVKRSYNQTYENHPLHIHGTLKKDIVLGIDNSQQIYRPNYILTPRGERNFVKPCFNEQYDKTRAKRAMDMISQSKIICTYGFSFGESDRTWVNALITWLREDKNHHLVVYQYDTTKYNRYNYDEMMDAEEDKKYAFMDRLGIKYDMIEEQIHIPISYDIFNFKFVKEIGAQTANPPITV